MWVGALKVEMQYTLRFTSCQDDRPLGFQGHHVFPLYSCFIRVNRGDGDLQRGSAWLDDPIRQLFLNPLDDLCWYRGQRCQQPGNASLVLHHLRCGIVQGSAHEQPVQIIKIVCLFQSSVNRVNHFGTHADGLRQHRCPLLFQSLLQRLRLRPLSCTVPGLWHRRLFTLQGRKRRWWEWLCARRLLVQRGCAIWWFERTDDQDGGTATQRCQGCVHRLEPSCSFSRGDGRGRLCLTRLGGQQV
ncbi:hypothetical protein V8C86DRAFT_2560563 [Haematococcus lacustris]